MDDRKNGARDHGGVVQLHASAYYGEPPSRLHVYSIPSSNPDVSHLGHRLYPARSVPAQRIRRAASTGA